MYKLLYMLFSRFLKANFYDGPGNGKADKEEEIEDLASTADQKVSDKVKKAEKFHESQEIGAKATTKAKSTHKFGSLKVSV